MTKHKLLNNNFIQVPSSLLDKLSLPSNLNTAVTKKNGTEIDKNEIQKEAKVDNKITNDDSSSIEVFTPVSSILESKANRIRRMAQNNMWYNNEMMPLSGLEFAFLNRLSKQRSPAVTKRRIPFLGNPFSYNSKVNFHSHQYFYCNCIEIMVSNC